MAAGVQLSKFGPKNNELVVCGEATVQWGDVLRVWGDNSQYSNTEAAAKLTA